MSKPTIKKEPTSPSILNTLNHVPVSMNGADCVNIDHKSDSELGKMLSPLYPINVKTIFGNIGTIKNFIDFITAPGYPYEMLRMKKFSPKEIARIPKNRKTVPNFWGAVAYAICERVKGDVKLLSLIKKNTLPYSSFNQTEEGIFFDKRVLVSIPNLKMSRYLSVIRHIELMVKSDTFNDETILNFINNCRDDITKDVFDDMAVSVTFNTDKTDRTES